MRKLLPLSLMLLLCAQRLYADPHTFAEFKALPYQERFDLVAADEEGHLHWKYVGWWYRLQMGDESWQRREQDRLADQNDYTALTAFFNEYQHLREEFTRQELARKKQAGLAGKELSAERERYSEAMQTASKIRPDAIALVASLAPTEDAHTLTQQVNLISTDLYKRYPDGTQWVLTPAVMAAIDQQAQQIMTKLKSLPKLTPEQVQAAIEALPDENPDIRGFPLPHK